MPQLVFPDDASLVAGLGARDERAFVVAVERFHPMLSRVARGYVRSDEAADDVVQETWAAVLRGIDGFQGRASLRTWIVAILVNIARTQGSKDARTVPFTGLASDADGRTFDADRFEGPDGEYPGHWTTPPTPWDEDPVTSALAGEARGLVGRALAELPATQRAVITLRDVEGWSGPEVSELLGVSEGNQRVLLHRARAMVRRALDPYLSGTD